MNKICQCSLNSDSEVCDSSSCKCNESLKVNQDRGPNFRGKDGKLFLVRCFACGPERGRENYAISVASGTCAWCGWSEEAK